MVANLYFCKTNYPFYNKTLIMMNLKLITLIFIIALATACNSNTKQENEALKAKIEALEKENNLLADGTYQMEMSMVNYHQTLQDIEAQLAAIDETKQLVEIKSEAFGNDASVEAEIDMHLRHLHEMNANAKQKIAHMSKSMNMLRRDNIDSHQQIHELENQTHDLARTVVERDLEIENLHQVVISKGLTIAALGEAYSRQKEYSDVLLEIINTGFYVAGTSKQLLDMGIIEQEGGFIGIGRVNMLNSDAPVEYIKPIDIRDTDIFEFDAKNASLITPHAEGSYEFTYTDEGKVILGISDKLKFWQETNYLVVELAN